MSLAEEEVGLSSGEAGEDGAQACGRGAGRLRLGLDRGVELEEGAEAGEQWLNDLPRIHGGGRYRKESWEVPGRSRAGKGSGTF